MTTIDDGLAVLRRRKTTLETVLTALRHALGWPGRVYEARALLAQMGRMSDLELRDIGLSRQDLRDATALDADADPSFLLRQRASQRRRRR